MDGMGEGLGGEDLWESQAEELGEGVHGVWEGGEGEDGGEDEEDEAEEGGAEGVVAAGGAVVVEELDEGAQAPEEGEVGAEAFPQKAGAEEFVWQQKADEAEAGEDDDDVEGVDGRFAG